MVYVQIYHLRPIFQKILAKLIAWFDFVFDLI